ncbi:hypothetical protein BAZSYMA_ACONTIG40284_0 [Bathymodiolus azoricus thioautotrophic gill symbiont]|uniref:Uncharacterized protein n=1 Tax=Bathymodiolus azoricus thioautotrophic gill symbiont TaxID=235205 RepID=A0A1H6L6R9_9GAMM|nr:hypothetical protein BAZSYMA_ACONTIG40284_0 [Bathymodiolus azoricus thioautotrophic gill symbiont]
MKMCFVFMPFSKKIVLLTTYICLRVYKISIFIPML